MNSRDSRETLSGQSARLSRCSSRDFPYKGIPSTTTTRRVPGTEEVIPSIAKRGEA